MKLLWKSKEQKEKSCNERIKELQDEELGDLSFVKVTWMNLKQVLKSYTKGLRKEFANKNDTDRKIADIEARLDKLEGNNKQED